MEPSDQSGREQLGWFLQMTIDEEIEWRKTIKGRTYEYRRMVEKE